MTGVTLPALLGTVPHRFLAALGVLSLVDRAGHPEACARLSWDAQVLSPIVHAPHIAGLDALARLLYASAIHDLQDLRAGTGRWAFTRWGPSKGATGPAAPAADQPDQFFGMSADAYRCLTAGPEGALLRALCGDPALVTPSRARVTTRRSKPAPTDGRGALADARGSLKTRWYMLRGTQQIGRKAEEMLEEIKSAGQDGFWAALVRPTPVAGQVGAYFDAAAIGGREQVALQAPFDQGHRGGKGGSEVEGRAEADPWACWLALEGLACYPAVYRSQAARGRKRGRFPARIVGTRGWHSVPEGEDEVIVWPLWCSPLSMALVRWLVGASFLQPARLTAGGTVVEVATGAWVKTHNVVAVAAGRQEEVYTTPSGSQRALGALPVAPR